MLAAWRWVTVNRIVLATGLAAAIPVLGSLLQALDNRWLPLADDAIIALRAYDVFSTHPPLVGQYSVASIPSVGSVYSPGPMLYWLLAPGARLFGPTGVALTVGLTNIASVMGAVALARRRGGLVLMFATAFGLALMCRSLPAQSLQVPWNPYIGLLPLTLLAFLAWSLARGEPRLLAVSVLVTSFLVQCHLTFAIPSLGLLALGTLGLFAQRRSWRATAPRRWLVAAVLAGAACWSAPLVDAAVNNPGNLQTLLRTAAAERPALGRDDAQTIMVKAIGVPLRWLRRPRDEAQEFYELVATPGTATVVSAALVVAALIGVVLVGLRRRSEAATGAGVALLLVAALGAVTAATPIASAPVIAYTLRWAMPVGMFAWLVLAFGLFSLRRPRMARQSAAPARGLRSAVVPLLAVLTAVGIAVALGRPEDRRRWEYAAGRAALIPLEAELQPGSTIVLASVSSGAGFDGLGFDLLPALSYGLRRHGVRVLVGPSFFAAAMGSGYELRDRGYDARVFLQEGTGPPPPDSHVLARVPLDGAPAPPRRRVLTISIAAGAAQGGTARRGPARSGRRPQRSASG